MFARANRQKGGRRVVGSAGILLLGYLLVWIGFSAVATLALASEFPDVRVARGAVGGFNDGVEARGLLRGLLLDVHGPSVRPWGHEPVLGSGLRSAQACPTASAIHWPTPQAGLAACVG
jgi:hypothetical protein